MPAFSNMSLNTSSIIRIVIVVIGIYTIAIFGLIKRPSYDRASVEVTPEQSLTGKELFLNNCARCHGDDAKGDKGPDLTSSKRQSKWAGSDEYLINKINKGGLFMPKFGKKLTPEE